MTRPLLLLAVLLLLLPLPAVAKDAEMVAARLEFEPGRVGSTSQNTIPFKDAPPKDVIVPTGLRTPRYSRIVMAGTKGLAIAFDANPESPRLWVDQDFDGNLLEEKRVWMKAMGSYFVREQSVSLTYPGQEGRTRVNLYFRYMPTNGDDYVSVYASAHRRGTVVLGGRLRLVALSDNNSDLRFNDPKRDQLFVDLDGNGRFETTGDAPERITLGEAFRAGDEGWIASVPDISGRVVEFTRSSTLPPAPTRTWPNRGVSRGGYKRTPPKASLDELTKIFEAEESKPYVERYGTVNQIGYVSTKDAFQMLKRIAAKDKDKNIRLAAIRAMGNVAYLEPGGAHALELADDADPTVQSAAANALHGMAHPKRAAVYARMVSSGQAAAVSGAISYLAYMRTPESRKLVLRAFEQASAPNTKYSVYVSGVRNIEGGPPPELMLRAANVDYAMLQAAAVTDLHLVGHPKAHGIAMALAKVRPVSVQTGQAVAQVLGATGDAKSVQALIDLFDGGVLHQNVSKAVLDQLRFIRAPKSLAVLIKAVKSKSPVVRRIAAEVLAGAPGKAATQALMKQAKKEKDGAAKAAQLEALGDHGDPAALGLLLKMARRKASKDAEREAARRAAIRALARLGMGHPEVSKFFLKLLGARKWVDRVLALDAAKSTGDPKLIPQVAKSLDHDEWQVRLAAVEALDGLRGKQAIGPLIARLSAETEERVRDAIAEALFRLTGQSFYDDAGVWADWWNKNEATFEVPDEIPERTDNDVGGTGAGFYGIPVNTDRVVFVIDQSGSMSAHGAEAVEEGGKDLNRLDVAVREVLAAIGKLKNRARVNVVLFHTTIHPWKPTLQPLAGKNRAALKRHLEGKSPTGGTNLYDGLELALQLKDVDTIFLLSDGVPGAGKYIATPDILRAVRRLNQTRRIAIHGISIGMDSDLLKRLAKENGGKYVQR